MQIKNNRKNREVLNKMFSNPPKKEFEPFPKGLKYSDLETEKTIEVKIVADTRLNLRRALKALEKQLVSNDLEDCEGDYFDGDVNITIATII